MPYNQTTGEYTPPAASGYYPSDLFNAGAPIAQYSQRTRKPQFQAKVIDTVPEGQIIAWRLILEDTQGGLNLTNGRFDLDYDRVSSSSLDTRYYNTLINHLKTYFASNGSTTVSVTGQFGATFNGLLHLGAGSAANQALYKETSVADPTLAAVTFTPNANITSLTPISSFNGGGTANQYLVVGDASGVARALSTAYANTNMNAATAALWGACQVFTDNDIMLYAGSTIALLGAGAALNSAPTTTLTGVPQGGVVLGLCKLAGAPVRVLMIWPIETDALVQFVGGRIISIDQEGSAAYEYVPLGLSRVYSADLVGDTAVVATDRKRVMLYDGRSMARDLRWNWAREANSDRELFAVAVRSVGNEIVVEVNSVGATGTSGIATQRWFEAYNLETNAWHVISTPQTLDTTSLSVIGAANGIPYAQDSRFLHIFSTRSAGGIYHSRLFLPPYGYNPYNQFRQTTGADTDTGYEFELSGTYTSPKWVLPGLEGCPSMVSKITFLGDVDAGGTSGTAAEVTVTAGNMTGTFLTGLSDRAQVVDLVDTGDVFYKLQVSVTQSRNTGSTRWTPQSLPIVIEGFSWCPLLQPPFGWHEEMS